MEESPRLTEASAQDIQLELVRRTQRNAFNGKRVFEDLKAHREWWKAVLLDKHSTFDLIKLRDLPYDHWNADTLFVLTTDESTANRLAELAEQWEADTVHIHSHDETQRQLGFWSSEPQQQLIVEFWWD